MNPSEAKKYIKNVSRKIKRYNVKNKKISRQYKKSLNPKLKSKLSFNKLAVKALKMMTKELRKTRSRK